MEQNIIYLRKSRADMEAEARGEGETLARHEHALLELARRQHLFVPQIYKEIVSGDTIAARPVMQKLLSEVEQGLWSGVLVMEVERLARGDTIDQGIVAQTFKFSNTKIITPMKTYDPNNEFDEEYFEFGLFMSRREYKTINRRLQRGRLTSVKEGKYVASRPPYGYDRKKLEHDKGFTLAPIEKQARVVKMIFELYTLGETAPDGTRKRLGVSLIVRKLNMLKIPPQRGDVWVNSSVRDILINPVYIGKIRWDFRPCVRQVENGHIKKSRPRNPNDNCTVVDGLHEPVIDEVTWKLAQDYMHRNRPRPLISKNNIQNSLAGLIICGKCGRHMVRRPYGNGQEASLICPVTSCNNVSSSLKIVEEKLLSALESWLHTYKIKISDNIGSHSEIQEGVIEDSLAGLNAGLIKLEKQSDSIYDLLEQGVYDKAKFLERSRALNDKIQCAKAKKGMLENELLKIRAVKNYKVCFLPKVQHVLEIYGTLPAAKEKNDLLHEILEKVIYTKNVNCRWHNSPDNFTLEIYPKVPVSE